MNSSVQQQVKTKKRRWAEMALGIASGLMLGLPLLVYTGIRKVSANKLPEINSDIKKGAAIGLVAAVSMFATIFSAGFAAPAVPAIVSGLLTCAAGIGGVVLVEKRAEKQQHAIQELQGKIGQMQLQQNGIAQVQQRSLPVSQANQPKFKVRKKKFLKQIDAIFPDDTRNASVGSKDFRPSYPIPKYRSSPKVR